MKLFIAEQGSEKMLRFAETADDGNTVVSSVAQIEARSAIARLYKGSRISSVERVRACDALASDVGRMIEQPVTTSVLETAIWLVDRHDLRGLDAVQLASAIVFRELLGDPKMRLIASDKALLEAALKEGFAAWDPMH